MSKDISTMYTKEENKKNGRKGYAVWKTEKETVIGPRDYGMFIQNRRKGYGIRSSRSS